MTDALRDHLQASLGAAYTLQRELGGGGMSRVFVAREEALGREVVVKVLPPELAQGLSADRFAREIRLAAALQEPHIVPVLTAGTTADAIPYYTMPFVRGESLRARLSRAPVPWPEAVGILRDVARALSYAHRQGVVHRDIKPENILLSEGTAVVTDFGIARAVVAARTEGMDAAATRGGTLTQAGVALGTPAYMAPEQAAGDVVDQRADLYAWGVVAYELLAGEHPFAGRTSSAQWIMAHLSEAPSPERLARGGAPAPLQALVLRTLQKEAGARPQTAGELLAELDAVPSPAMAALQQAEATPSHAPAPPFAAAGVASGGAPIGARSTRAWWAIAAAVLVVAAGAAGVALSRRGAPAADAREALTSLAVLPFQNIGSDSADAYLALGIADQLAVTLGKLPGMRVAPRVSSQVVAAQQRTPAEIVEALGVRALLTGSVRRAGDRLRVAAELVDGRTGDRLWSEEFEEQRGDVFAVEDRVSASIVQALRARLGDGASLPKPTVARGTVDREAYDLYIRGRFFWTLRSESAIARAIDYFHQAIARDPSFVQAISGLADAYAVSGFYSYVPPDEGFGQAKAMSERAMALDSSRAEPHASRAYVALYYDWDWARAEAEFTRAIALDSTYATAHQWFGNYLTAMGRFDEEIAAFGRAEHFDPLNRISIAAKCWGFMMAGRLREAVPQCDRAIELDSTFAIAHSWKGEALALAGDAAGAQRAHEAAVRFSKRSAVTLAALARSQARAGRRTDALRLVEDLRSPKQRYIPSYEIALVYANAGEPAQALTWLERAFAERSHSIAFLRVDPWLDPLRKEPRFGALLHNAKLD